MTVITMVGLGAGSLLVLSAVYIFVLKKEFPAGGIGVVMVGLVFIGMSQWSSFTLTVGPAKIEAMQQMIIDTARAAEAVAAQAEKAAAEVEATRTQLTVLTKQLEVRNVLPAATIRPIQERLSVVPKVDVSKLRDARKDLDRLAKPLKRVERKVQD